MVYRVSKSQTQLSVHTYIHMRPSDNQEQCLRVFALALSIRVTEQLPSEALPVIREKGDRNWQSHIGPQSLSLEGTNTASVYMSRSQIAKATPKEPLCPEGRELEQMNDHINLSSSPFTHKYTKTVFIFK